MNAGCGLLVIGNKAAELYSATGALLSHNRLTAAANGHDVVGAAEMSTDRALVWLSSSTDRSIGVFNGLCDHQLLARSDELPAPAVALATHAMPGTTAGGHREAVAVALLADGSLAALRTSPDLSQVAVAFIQPRDLWGSSSGHTKRSNSGRWHLASAAVGSNKLLAVAASGNHVAAALVNSAASTPAAAFVPVGGWSLEDPKAEVVAVAAATMADDVAAVTLLLRSGDAVVHLFGPDGSQVAEPQIVSVLPQGALRGACSAAAASCAGAVFVHQDGERLAGISMDVVNIRSNKNQVQPQLRCRPTIGSSPPGMHAFAVGVPRRGCHVAALTADGVVKIAMTPAPNSSAKPSSPAGRGAPGIVAIAASAIACAPDASLLAVRVELERLVSESSHQLATSASPNDVAAGAAAVHRLRQSAAALLDRERRMIAHVDAANSAVALLDNRLQRLEIAADALGLWAAAGCPPRPAESIATERAATAAELQALFASQLGVDTPTLVGSREFWYNTAAWRSGPTCLQLVAEAVGIDLQALEPSAAIVKVCLDAPVLASTPVALALFYLTASPAAIALDAGGAVGATALQQQRADVAHRLGVCPSLGVLAVVARVSDEAPLERRDLAACAACVGMATASGVLARAVVAQCFVQLSDAIAADAVASLMPLVLRHYDDAGHGAVEPLPDRVSMRVLCLAITACDSSALRVIEPSFMTAERRPLWVAALCYVAVRVGTAAEMEAVIDNDDVDLAAELLTPHAPHVAVHLLHIARKFDRALDLLERMEERDDSTVAFAAHLRGVAIQAAMPLLPQPAGPSTSDGGDGAAVAPGSEASPLSSGAALRTASLQVAYECDGTNGSPLRVEAATQQQQQQPLDAQPTRGGFTGVGGLGSQPNNTIAAAGGSRLLPRF